MAHPKGGDKNSQAHQPEKTAEEPGDKAGEVGVLQRLEAKLDQVIGDNKALQQKVSDLETWVKRMTRVAKGRV